LPPLSRVTVVLVALGVRVTADSVCVVVVVAGSLTTVVQEVRNMVQAGRTGIKRISFFILLDSSKQDSAQVASADVLKAKSFN
jgi:hypothetical protein